jgi:hypothetical protein
VRQRLDHLKYPTLKGRFWSDTSFASVTSRRGHSIAQQFTNGCLGCERFYPMKSKSKAPAVLMSFTQDAGIPPTTLVADNAHEETYGEWGTDLSCLPHPTKAHSAGQSVAEPGRSISTRW